MASLKDLENEIKRIKQRNKKVEADKDWELSWMRKVIVAVFTYLIIVIFFYTASLPKPFLNSIVPALAFVLSTFTLPFFKKFWLKYVHK